MKRTFGELTKEELAELDRINAGHKILSIEDEAISECYVPSTKEGKSSEFLTATDILSRISERYPKVRFNPVRVGVALTRLGFERGSDGTKKGYYVISKQ